MTADARGAPAPPLTSPASVRRWAADLLGRSGIEQGEATAELLLRYVLGGDRAALVTRTAPLTTDEASALRTCLDRRIGGEPVQLIVGSQAFRALELSVRPGVFVPRPETELLVDHALLAIADHPAPLVVDVGTGSGAIALAIAHEHRGARVVATDRSRAAVDLARTNADRLGLPIEIVACDLLSGMDPVLRGSVDLVVSNPPYVQEGADLPLEVLADPPSALFGGPELSERLIGSAASWLRPGGALVLEIGEQQGTEVLALLEPAFTDARVHDDLAGRPRVATGRRR